GDHQRINAESLVRGGAAVCLPSREATPARIAAEINGLFADSSRLLRMAKQATKLGRPEAAHAIAMDLLGLAGLASAVGRVARVAARSGSGEPPLQFESFGARAAALEVS
ncbi:MAG TPA: glycosyltransferase, partial [Polyangiaceae bacterium]